MDHRTMNHTVQNTVCKSGWMYCASKKKPPKRYFFQLNQRDLSYWPTEETDTAPKHMIPLHSISLVAVKMPDMALSDLNDSDPFVRSRRCAKLQMHSSRKDYTMLCETPEEAQSWKALILTVGNLAKAEHETSLENQSENLKRYRSQVLEAVYRIVCNVVELSVIILSIQTAVERVRIQEYNLFESYNVISITSPALTAKAIVAARRPFDKTAREELNNQASVMIESLLTMSEIVALYNNLQLQIILKRLSDDTAFLALLNPPPLKEECKVTGRRANSLRPPAPPSEEEALQSTASVSHRSSVGLTDDGVCLSDFSEDEDFDLDSQEANPASRLIAIIQKFEKSLCRLEDNIPLEDREILLEKANFLLKSSYAFLQALEDGDDKTIKNECRELSSIVSEFERLYRRVLELIDLNKAAELEGYLWKTGPRGKAYDKRFFQLRGNILSYARKERMKPVGSIDMCRATSLADDPEAPLNFNIITPHRTFNFKASNDYDKAMWVEALGQKIDYSQNIEGYLWKFSSGRWQQKWFMCQGGELCYSKNIKSRERKTIELTEVCAVKALDDSLHKRQFCFAITLSKGDMILQAQDVADQMRWIRVVEMHTRHYSHPILTHVAALSNLLDVNSRRKSEKLSLDKLFPHDSPGSKQKDMHHSLMVGSIAGQTRGLRRSHSLPNVDVAKNVVAQNSTTISPQSSSVHPWMLRGDGNRRGNKPTSLSRSQHSVLCHSHSGGWSAPPQVPSAELALQSPPSCAAPDPHARVRRRQLLGTSRVMKLLTEDVEPSPSDPQRTLSDVE